VQNSPGFFMQPLSANCFLGKDEIMPEQGQSIHETSREFSRMERNEKIAGVLLKIAGLVAVAAVAAITVYLVGSGLPALIKIGPLKMLFGTVWQPTAADPKFGIAYVILTSIIGTALAILIGVPIGLFTAIFLAEIAPPRVASIIHPAVDLLAGIPSVVYGLLGLVILNPLMYKWELALFRNDPTHQFTGGANMLSAILVLAIMILPTVISVSETSIHEVPDDLRSGSLALGATKMQTIFRVVLPTAKSGILTAVVLGVGRAIGEAMAITLVSGSSVNFPLPFHSVRFLTTAIVSEMGYASGLHRQALFTIGMVLFAFIMVINSILLHIGRSKREDRG